MSSLNHYQNLANYLKNEISLLTSKLDNTRALLILVEGVLSNSKPSPTTSSSVTPTKPEAASNAEEPSALPLKRSIVAEDSSNILGEITTTSEIITTILSPNVEIPVEALSIKDFLIPSVFRHAYETDVKNNVPSESRIQARLMYRENGIIDQIIVKNYNTMTRGLEIISAITWAIQTAMKSINDKNMKKSI